jgi:hypothetical protein
VDLHLLFEVLLQERPQPSYFNLLAIVTSATCLCCSLLLPFGQLLGRLWHSTTAPSGMLLAVDAEAPRLVARSIYYKTLNGGPFCHDIFAVELPGPYVSALCVACSCIQRDADKVFAQVPHGADQGAKRM